MTAGLEVRGLAAGYERGDIVRDVDLEVAAGEIVTVIGPNGAGKSTLIKAMAGVLRPRRGTVRMDGVPLAGLRASEIARLGVAYVPQEGNVFRSLTVRENLELGSELARARRRAAVAAALDLFPALAGRMRARAGDLSGGERQMVALAMALMVEPRVLLLDEPSAGLSPRLVDGLFATLGQIHRRGVALLMVEQNARRALGLSHRGYVMAGGQVRLVDRADALLDNREVAALYLGATR